MLPCNIDGSFLFMHANQCFILGPNVVSGHTASHSWSRKAYWFPCACVYIQLRDSSSQVTGHTTCFNKVLLYPPLINSRYWTFVLDVLFFFHSHTFTHPQLNVSNVCKPLSLWCWTKGTFSSPDEDLTMNRCSRQSGFSWGALSLKEGNATYVFNRL